MKFHTQLLGGGGREAPGRVVDVCVCLFAEDVTGTCEALP